MKKRSFCVSCKQPFNRQEVSCNRCGACQGCKKTVADRMGNYCQHCGNSIDQSRYDEDIPTMYIVK